MDVGRRRLNRLSETFSALLQLPKSRESRRKLRPRCSRRLQTGARSRRTGRDRRIERALVTPSSRSASRLLKRKSLSHPHTRSFLALVKTKLRLAVLQLYPRFVRQRGRRSGLSCIACVSWMESNVGTPASSPTSWMRRMRRAPRVVGGKQVLRRERTKHASTTYKARRRGSRMEAVIRRGDRALRRSRARSGGVADEARRSSPSPRERVAEPGSVAA
ncbi:hypothetical protein HPB51_014828 [Rhipicephalus microplus]|uniref:Uncharacterized protein n=1 Tax=Rhipicephalus microplus TaxID=6941 RepID=A0A9J6DNK5_RHIMP|nr:hypothetical protein HPB51_014828 [Rhipicephalus microplus]